MEHIKKRTVTNYTFLPKYDVVTLSGKEKLTYS